MYEKQLKYIMTIASAGSFSRAADILDIAQPSLSQYIKKIERQFGVELFDRSGSNVQLTDAGRVYIESGRRILEMERQMESRFQDIMMNRYGTVRVGISAHRSVCLMPRILRAFKEEYPGITVVLDERNHSSLMDAAEYGEFDLCVTTLPVDKKLYSVEPLFREEMILAVPADSTLCETLRRSEKNGKVDISLVNGSDFAMLNDDHLMQRNLNALMSEHGLHLNKTVECTSLEALIAMVGVGMGAALIPECLRNIASENIEYFRIEQVVPMREIVAVYRKDHYLSNAAKSLLDYMKEMLK